MRHYTNNEMFHYLPKACLTTKLGKINSFFNEFANKFSFGKSYETHEEIDMQVEHFSLQNSIYFPNLRKKLYHSI